MFVHIFLCTATVIFLLASGAAVQNDNNWAFTLFLMLGIIGICLI